MMRSLWTAASGMRTQQTTIDVIANNLANVNTTSYKREAAEFKSLLYQTIQTKTTTANGEQKPIDAQVGLGVRNSSISTAFRQGPVQPSDGVWDFAIQGNGFFRVRGEDGEVYYTRTGKFQMAIATNGTVLATAEGLPVLDTNGASILFDSSIDTAKLIITEDGRFCYPDEENNPKPLGVQMGLVQFTNPAGLIKTGDSMYQVSEASGDPVLETSGNVKKSRISQGYLEASNVQVVDEMVDMIIAQRAYEMNSKAITTSDEMLGQANQLKR